MAARRTRAATKAARPRAGGDKLSRPLGSVRKSLGAPRRTPVNRGKSAQARRTLRSNSKIEAPPFTTNSQRATSVGPGRTTRTGRSAPKTGVSPQVGARKARRATSRAGKQVGARHARHSARTTRAAKRTR